MSIAEKSARKHEMTRAFVLLVLVGAAASVQGFAFTAPVFPAAASAKAKTAPAKQEGVEIEMPNFDELFGRYQQISPLARQAIQGCDGEPGFATVDDSWPPDLKWKVVESNKRRTLHHIDKIDNFMKLGPPLLRFRASLKGPCIGEIFANFIMELEDRKKWDAQIAETREIYPVQDLDTVNAAMGHGKYGTCTRFGVGYCKTKQNLGISPREQLTLCGIQDFEDGCCIIWGTEMEEWHNHLLPPGKRVPRAKSHHFCTTLVPTGDNTFDVEYVLQMEIGGNIPGFLTGPIVTDTVKHLFKYAETYFAGGEGSELQKYLMEKGGRDSLGDSHSILMPQ